MKYLGIVFILCLSSPIWALTPADEQKAQEARENSLIQQQKLEEQRLLDRLQELREQPKTQALPLKTLQTEKAETGFTSFHIDRVRVLGAETLSETQIATLVENYKNRLLDINLMNNLVREITNAYIKKGYITTRAYIPEQDLKRGILTVQVIEGKVESIVINDDPNNLSQVRTAFPWLMGKILNIRDIEQGLEQMNRLQSNHARVRFVPGEKMGYTKVLIENKQSHNIDLRMRYDDSTDRGIGVFPQHLVLSTDNLLKRNDTWSLSYAQDNKGNSQHTNSTSLTASIPFGYWTTQFTYSAFNHASTVAGDLGNFFTSGKTQSGQWQLQRVISRTQNTKTSIDANLSLKSTIGYIGDVFITDKSRRLAIVRLGGESVIRTPKSVWSIAPHYDRGLKGLYSDGNLAHFHRADLRVSYYRPNLSVFDMPLTFRANAYGQYSWNTLYASERLTIGDRYTVRGFSESIQGDSGAYLRTELESPRFKSTSLYLGLDIGFVEKRGGAAANPTTWQGTMYSHGIGLRTQNKRISADAYIGFPIRSASWLNPAPYEIDFQITFGKGR